ncbi:MAG: stage III sporulation protein AE, partial [Coriobacteriales bacterium]
MTANGKSLRVSSLPLSGNEKQRRSKRKRFFIRLAALFFLAFFCMPCTVFAFAEEGGDGKEELNQNILDQIDKLDTEELQKYIDSLGVFSDKNVGERIFDYIKGEKFDYGSFGQQILNVLFEDVKNMLPAFACICAVALLCGILSSVKSSFADQTSADVIFLVGYAAALIPVLAVLTECF